MIYATIILGAGVLTLFLMRSFVGFKVKSTNGPGAKRQTNWVSAVLWSLFFAFMFGDPIIVHNLSFALWGDASIFFAVFFLQIYLDERTKMRGLLLGSSILILGIFYYIYSVTPASVR